MTRRSYDTVVCVISAKKLRIPSRVPAGRAVDVITIAASDDTGVVRVNVRLTDRDGVVLEKGTALLDGNGR